MTETERTDRAESPLSAEQRESLRREILRRLESGEYGLCAECGGEISVDRLLVFPETSICVSCSG